jgi:hypothetical protein
MFHWICPECGREIPPAVTECPACDPRALAAEAAKTAPVADAVAPAPPPALPVVEAQAADAKAAAGEAAEANVAQIKAAESEVSEAKAAEPEVAEVKAAKPEVAEVKAAEPEVTEVKAAEPEFTEVKAAEPEVAEAKAAESEVTEVKAAEPEVAEVKAAESEFTEVKAAEPEVAEVKAAEPKVAEVKAAEPEVAEVKAAEPEVAEVKAAEAQPENAATAQLKFTEAVEPQPAEVKAAEAEAPQPVPASVAEVEQPADLAVEVPMDPLLALAETIYAAQTGKPREKRPERPLSGAPSQAPEPVTAAHKPEKPAAAAKSPVIPTMPAALADLASAIGIDAAPAVEATRELVPAMAAPAPMPAHQGQQAVALLPAGEAVALLAPPALAPEPAIAPEVKPEPAAFQGVAAPQTIPVPPAISALAVPADTPNTAGSPAASVAAAPPPPASVVETPAVPPAPVAPIQQAVEPSVERPPSGSWLNLAPLQNYKAATRQSLQPATLPSKIVAHDTGPRITLPGPTLPPELVSLQETGVVTVLGDPAKQKKTGRGMPGWAVSFLVMMALLVSGIIVVFYFSPISHSSADAKPTPENVEVPTAAAPAPVSHSLADMIEVTGFRILVDYNKKSEIHYLVVNHSSNELNDMTVYVTLHAAGAKPGQPPLCRFSFRAPALKAFEVKEMSASIEKLTRSVTLPDWQELRAEVQVAP